MAKSAKALATTGAAGLPAHLQSYKSTGAGVPTDSRDFLIPMAKVLDPKSPECMKGNANRVTGAEAGDIFVKNSPSPIVKGDVGLLFQPCYREEAVVEWIPRNKGGGGGQGFVAKHPANYIENGKDCVQKPHPENEDKLVWYRKSSGNLLVDTRYVGGYWIHDVKNTKMPMPCIFSFTSTGHSVAKTWNMLIASKSTDGQSTADLWLVYYRITTRLRQRGEQSWYMLDVADAAEPDKDGDCTLWVPTIPDRERGRKLHMAMTRGEKQMDMAGGVTVDDDSAAAEERPSRRRM